MEKKISFIIGSISGGGSEKVCINLANGLVKRGWKINLFFLNLREKKNLKKISKKVNLINLNSKSFLMSFIKMTHYIKKNNIKHIFCFHYIIATKLVILRFLFNKNFSIIARNNISLSKTEEYNFKNNLKKRLIFKIIKLVYPKVEFCISQCNDMRTDLIRNYGFKKKNIKVIYNPVKYEIENNYKNNNFKKDNFILLVGRLAKQKRQEIAIRLFSKISKKNSKLKLKIAGKGDQEKFLKNLVLKYGLEKNVKFLGYKENLVKFYKKAKLTILTSAYEGFPNVLIESITLGTPVISFNCPYGPREIIKNGINGYLVNNDNEINFEKKIIKALDKTWNSKRVNSTASIYKNSKILDKYEIFLSNIIKN